MCDISLQVMIISSFDILGELTLFLLPPGFLANLMSLILKDRVHYIGLNIISQT